jgi:hypothetical protein
MFRGQLMYARGLYAAPAAFIRLHLPTTVVAMPARSKAWTARPFAAASLISEKPVCPQGRL